MHPNRNPAWKTATAAPIPAGRFRSTTQMIDDALQKCAAGQEITCDDS